MQRCDCYFTREKGPFNEWMAAAGVKKLSRYPWKKEWLQVLASKKQNNLSKTRSLHVASWNNDGTT